MNTVNTIGRDPSAGSTACRAPPAAQRTPPPALAKPSGSAASGPDSVFSGVREYAPQVMQDAAPDARNGRKRARHAPVVCIVFSCIQMPNAYKISPLALLP